MTKTVAVIDYGMGNIHSVVKALEHVAPKTKVIVVTDPKSLQSVDRVVFPGVGAIRDCIQAIRARGFDEAILNFYQQSQPILAICVGMQALFERSDENGGIDCLGIVPGHVKYFGATLLKFAEKGLKVPHMGWNQVNFVPHPMFASIEPASRFYFVHSYYVEPVNQDCVVAQTEYGLQFPSVIMQDTIFAVQFHPEKSQHAGLKLLENFMNWTP